VQRGLLLAASAVLAAAGVLAVIAAVRAQGQAAERAAAALEREKALILAVDRLTDANSQRHGLHAVR
jgi:hypothetical protein